MFRTAFPFGYLIFYGFLMGVAVLGVALIIMSRIFDRKCSGGMIAGMVMVGAVVAIIGVNAVFDGAMEWNTAASRKELVGLWHYGETDLTLRSDGTFLYDEDRFTDEKSVAGTWALSDWNLRLVDDSLMSRQFRVVRYFGRYRLMWAPIGDPDTWDDDLGFDR
jgi:hypothetical protein